MAEEKQPKREDEEYDEVDAPILVEARNALTRAARAVTELQADLADAQAEYARASLALTEAQGGVENPPLHELNRRQDVVTRHERAARVRAQDVFGQLANHFNPRVRQRRARPLHPDAIPAAEGAKVKLES